MASLGTAVLPFFSHLCLLCPSCWVGEDTVLATVELALFPSAYREARPLYATLSKKLFGLLGSLDGFAPLPDAVNHTITEENAFRGLKILFCHS